MTKKAFILGALMGGAVAGIAVALTTPKNGKEVREDLMDMGTDLKNRSVEMKDSLQDLVEDGKELGIKVKEVALENKDLLLSLKDDVQKSLMDWSEETAHNRVKIQEELDNIQSTIEKLEKDVIS